MKILRAKLAICIFGLSLVGIMLRAGPIDFAWDGKGVQCISSIDDPSKLFDNNIISYKTDRDGNTVVDYEYNNYNYSLLLSKAVEAGITRATINISADTLFPATDFTGTSATYSLELTGAQPVDVKYNNDAVWRNTLYQISQQRSNGISTTAICCIWTPTNGNHVLYYYGGDNPHGSTYGFNMRGVNDDGSINYTAAESDKQGAYYYAAMLKMLYNAGVRRFVIGNEVQSPSSYFLGDPSDINTLITQYSRAINFACKVLGSDAIVYASFNYHWTKKESPNTSMESFAGRDIVAALLENCHESNWGIAWHPYTASLNPGALAIADANSCPSNFDALNIMMNNIDVLVHYVNRKGIRSIILSEQGYGIQAQPPSASDLNDQAVALAYYYLRAASCAGIDELDWMGFMMDRNWSNFSNAGLLTSSAQNKPCYDVYKASGTASGRACYDNMLVAGKLILGDTANTPIGNYAHIYPSVVRSIPGDKWIANYSHRGYVDKQYHLIGGFYFAGGDKKLLIRAIGAGLNPFGLPSCVQNVKLTIRSVQSPGNSITSNDDWGSNDAGEITKACNSVYAFNMAGTDAAIVVTLPPGGYLAEIEPVNDNDSGYAMLELYDMDGIDSKVPVSRLQNFSSNYLVKSGYDGVSSVIISGNGSMGLLVRAVGPTLAARYKVKDALATPHISWKRAGSAFEYVNNYKWCDAMNKYQIVTAQAATYAFELFEGSLDSAAYVRVYPDSYSLVTDSQLGTGRCLSEIYLTE